jgi:hypothetical protein
MANARIFDVKRGVLSTTDAGTATLDIPVPTNTVMIFDAVICVKKSGNVGGLNRRQGSIHNNGGTVALDGSVIEMAGFAQAMDGGLLTATSVFTANSTNLRLTVTGVAAIGVVDWQYEIKLIVN